MATRNGTRTGANVYLTTNRPPRELRVAVSRGGSGSFTPSAELDPEQSELSGTLRIWHVNLKFT